jgi:hypothetical protein
MQCHKGRVEKASKECHYVTETRQSLVFLKLRFLYTFSKTTDYDKAFLYSHSIRHVRIICITFFTSFKNTCMYARCVRKLVEGSSSNDVKG